MHEPLRTPHALGRARAPRALDYAHVQGLLEAGRGVDWSTMQSTLTTLGSAEEFISEGLLLQERGEEYEFTVLSNSDSHVLGSTRYLDVNERHRGVEIRWICYPPGSWGDRGQPRVQASTVGGRVRRPGHCCGPAQDGRPQPALAARHTEARREVRGTLGNHIIRQDGALLNSTLYPITSEEWPTVKEGLLKRLTEQRFEPGRTKPTLGVAPLVRPNMGKDDQRQKPAYRSPPREMDVDGTEGKVLR